MSELNSDGNGNTLADEPFITVSDLAEQIGVPLPRLMRVLKRSQFAPHVGQRDRPTRTGTRTVTVVSVSVLSDLESILRDPIASGVEQKHKREHPEALAFDGEGVGGVTGTPTYTDFVEMQRRAEVAEARAALLEVALDREADAHKRAEVLHLGTQGQLDDLRRRAAELESMNRQLIEALPVMPLDDQKVVPEAVSDPDTNASGPGGQVDATDAHDLVEVVAETVRRAEQAEGKLMVANDSLALERATRESAERELQAVQAARERDAARPWWQKIFGGGR